ncbi:MAG: SDR family NAD(P)-dependent oxidoreductase [Bacteroidota bacterium]
MRQKGIKVKGSTTTTEKLPGLQRLGIEPALIRLHSHVIEGPIADFVESDVLLLNTPPVKQGEVETHYPLAIERLLKQISQTPILKRILFISSTSVYGDPDGEITEQSPLTPTSSSGKALVKVEQMLQEAFPSITIVRFGGLLGYNRKPGRFLAGKTNLKGGNKPVNLIHQDDCVNILEAIIEQKKWGEAFNAVAREHPVRKDFYHHAAAVQGFVPPQFLPENGISGKRINSEKVRKVLGYQFKYDDPFDMITNV